MSNVFEPAANDLSLIYLEQIFGTMTLGNLLPADVTSSAGPLSILGVMFQTFNTIILSVASVIVIYMTVVGVLMTAHEGEFMKKWNSLWAPLRAVFGIAALFPTATGYSSIQLLMMWVIINGVGAADQLWKTALQYVDVMGSVYAQGQAPTAGVKTAFTNLFSTLACEETALNDENFNTKTLNNKGLYYCFVQHLASGDGQGLAGNVDPFCSHMGTRADYSEAARFVQTGLDPNQQLVELDQMYVTPGVQTFGPQGSCGKLYYCDINSACAMPDGTNLWKPSVATLSAGESLYDFAVSLGNPSAKMLTDLNATEASSLTTFTAAINQQTTVAKTPYTATTVSQGLSFFLGGHSPQPSQITDAQVADFNNKLQSIDAANADSAATCFMCAKQIKTLAQEVYALRMVAGTFSALDYQYTYGYYNQNDHPGDQVPWFGANFCKAKFIATTDDPDTNRCFGQPDYDYSDTADTGSDTTQSQSSLASAKQKIGALPDPKLGSDGPSVAVITDVIWPYGLRRVDETSIWDLSLTPEQNALTRDPIHVATTAYINDTNTASDNLQCLREGGTWSPVANGIPTMQNSCSTGGVNPNLISSGNDAQAIKDEIAKIRKENPSGVYGIANDKGWIVAGGYYYFLVANNGHTMTTGLPRLNMLSINPTSANDESGYSDLMKTYRNDYAAATVLAKLMANDSPTNFGGSNMDNFGDASQAAQAALMNSTGNSRTNPLIQVAAQGYILLQAAQIIFAAFLLLTFVIGLMSGISFSVLGTGFVNPFSVAFPLIMAILTPLMGLTLGVMVTMGATLCVYVPLIPYMIFTFGAIGWMISTVEAMVAGPLVALGIIAPGGHSEMLGKAEPALLLLFGIFLRPSLMIFGLIASMLISCVALELVNQAFWPLVYPQITSLARTGGASISSSNGSWQNQASTVVQNPLMSYFFLIAYVALIVAVLNKSFAAIHIIPEKVMRWISGTGDSYGESEGLSSVKGAVDSEAGKLGGEMAKKAEGSGAAAQKKMSDDKGAARKAADDSKPGAGE